MFFIGKKLINQYFNKKFVNIYTKKKSNIITKEAVGKSFFIYNGRKWVKKDIDRYSYLFFKVGELRGVQSKVRSSYKSKKKKKKKNKKKPLTNKHKKK